MMSTALHLALGLALELLCLALGLTSELVGLSLGLASHLVCLALSLASGLGDGLLDGASDFLCWCIVSFCIFMLPGYLKLAHCTMSSCSRLCETREHQAVQYR